MLATDDLNPFKNIVNQVPYVTRMKEAAHLADWDGGQCAPLTHPLQTFSYFLHVLATASWQVEVSPWFIP